MLLAFKFANCVPHPNTNNGFGCVWILRMNVAWAPLNQHFLVSSQNKDNNNYMWLKMGKWVINILAPWTPEFTTGSNPVKPMWSSCETHVKLLCETPCEINSASYTKFWSWFYPVKKMCEIEHFFSNWKSQVKQYVKYPLIVRNILWNQKHSFKI